MRYMWQYLGSLVLLSFAMFGSGSIESLTAENFAIVQFDSRPMSNYWQAAAEWNQQYCQRHGHQFLYYNLDGECHYKDEPLASAWCKVKAMINAMEDHPTAHVFYYMDSDAVIDMAFETLSLKNITLNMKGKLNWNPDEKPIIFNQDGPCWWCRLIIKIGYTMCLNAGTVVWYRHALSEKILREWWDSSMDSYETNPIKRRFRLKWPWEQDRQMAVYNRSSQHIQVASQPERIFMQAKAGIVNGWCLSHLPDAECYISHYCANAKQKQEMRRIYSISNVTAIKINSIHFDPV